MGFKTPEQLREYNRDYQRRRRAEKSEGVEVHPPALTGSVTSTLPRTESAESPSAAAIKEVVKEKEVVRNQPDGQVHLLSGSIGTFRNPQVVYDMSKRLLLTQGWCVWRYPTLGNEAFVIVNGNIVPKVKPPLNLPVMVINPDKIIEVELQRNIPGSMYS